MLSHLILTRFISLVVAVASILTSSYASAAAFPRLYIRDHQYRFLAEPDERCSDKFHADQQVCYSSIGVGKSPENRYSMNFVEYSDKGKLFDSNQLEAVKTRLEEARNDNQQVIVFIYIHGWHNNAGPRYNDLSKKNCGDNLYDGDVAKFEMCGVRKIANDYPSSPGAKSPRVVGIYLAWHGEDFTPWSALIPYYVPSYIFRRHYAYKIGQSGLEEGLQQILCVIEQNRRSYFVIAMGHSFGARVLENAALMLDPAHPQTECPANAQTNCPAGQKTEAHMLPPSPESGLLQTAGFNEQNSAKLYEERQLMRPQVPLGPVPSQLPIDLVFYVNAATSSSRTRKTISDWNAHCPTQDPSGCKEDPLYFAVSSRADILTAFVMPIANFVFPAWSTDGFHILSAANTPWMQTHSIPKRIPSSPATLPPHAFCFKTPNEKYLYEVDPKPGDTQTRFWIMNSDHRYAALEGIVHKIPLLRRTVKHDWVISAHGDVWNGSVFNMIYALIKTQGSAAKQQATCYEDSGKQFLMK